MPNEANPLLKKTALIPDLDLGIYTIAELELLTQPSYVAHKDATEARKNASGQAKNFKKVVATRLSEVFETGSDQTNPDAWKVHKYKEIAGIPSTAPGNSYFNTETFYNWHPWWFTGIRLFLVRLGRILAKIGRGFLPPLFSVLGLSYGIGLAVDLFVVFKVSLLRPRNQDEKAALKELRAKRDEYTFFAWQALKFKLFLHRLKTDSAKARWERFKNIIRKDNRPYRMLNDFVWFAINVIVFCTAGPLYLLLNPILNLIGFAFDTGHEFFWLGRDAQKHMRLTKKLNAQIKALEKKLENLNDKEHAPEKANIKAEIEKLSFIRDQIKIKRNEVIRRRLWISVCTALVLVGMVLIYFPPTTLPGAFFIGAGLALVAGSLFTGLGRRTYLTLEKYGPSLIKKFMNWRKSKTVAPTREPAPDSRNTAQIKEALETSISSSPHQSDVETDASEIETDLKEEPESEVGKKCAVVVESNSSPLSYLPFYSGDSKNGFFELSNSSGLNNKDRSTSNDSRIIQQAKRSTPFE